MVKLTVNVDHVATVRQARRIDAPDPVWGAVLAELGGADGITAHLREDRRHVSDRDIRILRETVKVPLNLEMGLAPDIIEIALETAPHFITVVPEKREEITTEGGLDVSGGREKVGQALARFREAGIPVSLFIDPEEGQIRTSAELGAWAVELHTGTYCEARDEAGREKELTALAEASALAAGLGLRVHAGHGLDYNNVGPVAAIREVSELAIGHSIVGRAIYVGMTEAVREMKNLIRRAVHSREK
jgi:pyridoxine 5-phosphate synthase